MTDRMNELQYQDVSTYLRAWYKGKKNDSPIELGSDLGHGRSSPRSSGGLRGARLINPLGHTKSPQMVDLLCHPQASHSSSAAYIQQSQYNTGTLEACVNYCRGAG
jgi:hypothetical protein